MENEKQRRREGIALVIKRAITVIVESQPELKDQHKELKLLTNLHQLPTGLTC